MIVDEEQDSSYKQEETPRYHARDVAVMRAKFSDAVVVLGTATPSLESYFNAKKGRYALMEMPDRVEKRPLPEVELVDMRQEFQETGKEQVVSRKLIEEIRLRLERKEQACHRAHPPQTQASDGMPLLRLHGPCAKELRVVRK